MSKKNSLFKQKKVIVTGGEGFIGRALIGRLENNGAKVISLDKKNGYDLCDWNKISLIKNINKIDCLYHLAAVSFVPYAWKNPRNTYHVNLLSMINVLELCRIKGIKKLVIMSSYIYGQPQYLSIDENHPTSPTNPYMWSKFLCEQLCHGYARDFGIKVVILRPFNVYGAGQRDDFLIPSIIKQVQKSSEVILIDLRPKRDFLYIDDMIDALLAVGNYDVKSVEIFNIGFGKSWSIRELVKHLAEASDKKIRVVSKNIKRKDEILDVVADIGKAKTLLKWSPKISIEEGIKRVWEGRPSDL